MKYSIAAVPIVLALTACAGSPPAPITIPDPLSYIAQSRSANGDATNPLRAPDPMVYRRFDFGHVQASDSFLTGPASAITTWSYAPWGPFVAANGDGGETYELQGDAVHITYTKHGGIPTTELVPHWTALTTSTVPCNQGWTTYSLLERGCQTSVVYPGLGPIPTVVSEHLNPVEHFAERIFLARGWGRLAWQTFRQTGAPVDPTRCPDFGWNSYSGWALTDCR